MVIGLSTVSLGPAKGLEEGHGHKASGIRQGGVACLVPVCVVFTSDNVKEVAPRKAELLGRLRFIIVESSNYLQS